MRVLFIHSRNRLQVFRVRTQVISTVRAGSYSLHHDMLVCMVSSAATPADDDLTHGSVQLIENLKSSHQFKFLKRL